jgi:hypothetical protein
VVPLLLSLETAINWSGVVSGFRTDRRQWIKSVESAVTVAAFMDALLAFERYVARKMIFYIKYIALLFP